MKNWQAEQLQALNSINCTRQEECEKEVFSALLAETKHLGFKYCAYTRRIPFPVSRPEIIFISNYPQQWKQIYKDNDYVSIDPTILHGLRSSLPIS